MEGEPRNPQEQPQEADGTVLIDCPGCGSVHEPPACSK